MGRRAGLGRGPGAGSQPTLDSRRRSPRRSGRGAWGKPPASGTALHPQRCCHTWNHSSWWSGRGYQYKTPGLFSVERQDSKWDVRATEFALNTHTHTHTPFPFELALCLLSCSNVRDWEQWGSISPYFEHHLSSRSPSTTISSPLSRPSEVMLPTQNSKHIYN